MSLLQLEKVNLAFDGRTVLHDVDFRIEPRQICTIIGPNGAGKSTLIKVMTGLLPADSGKVTRAAKLQIGYVPQRLKLDNSMPITVARLLKLSAGYRAAKTMVLEQLEIEHLLQQQLHGLSGGELQRVLLARAIMAKPQLLVLDEPLQGVDVSGQARLYHLIGSLREVLDCAIVMVSHDLHLVMAQTDFVVCLNQHVCCEGRPENVSRHPEYLRLFGHALGANIAVYTHKHDHQHDLHGDVVGECGHSHD